MQEDKAGVRLLQAPFELLELGLLRILLVHFVDVEPEDEVVLIQAQLLLGCHHAAKSQ